MLDEGPKQQAPYPPPDSTDPARLPREDEPSDAEDVADDEAGSGASQPGGPPTPSSAPTVRVPVTEPSAVSLMRADLSDAWRRLDPDARLLVGASIAAIAIVIVGLPLGVWDSAPFALLVLAAGITTAVTGWFGRSSAFRDLPIARVTIELVSTTVVAILAVLKTLEIVFDLDTAGIVALIVGGALVAAAVGQVLAAHRRGADLRGITRGDQGTRIAAVGLLLVLIGWAFNLSISFWTMGQAALPLAVLTIAALTIAEAQRIESPVPAAWVGAGIAGFGALLALAHWGDLTSLGRTEIQLDPGHFVGITAYTAGIALVIAGGILSGRAKWTPARNPTDPPALDPPALDPPALS
jgi:hypothetical protein